MPNTDVDGKEIETLETISPDDIKEISVLKDASATALYGEKGKNGVILITTQTNIFAPLIFVDGKEFHGELNDIPVEEISSMDVVKDKAALKIYGDKAKNGIIRINSKTKYNSLKKEPLIVIDGEISETNIDEIDPESIKSVNVLKDESATVKYGDKGKNGVVEITRKNSYNNKIAVKNTTQIDDGKITTHLDLRKFIAKKIKYPAVAQENGIQGNVQLFVKVNNKGEITKVTEKPQVGDLMLEEVVVVAYLPENTEITTKRTSKLLKEEAKRVINEIPSINIPEFKGQTVGITMKFILQ